ncbi:MAG: RdgB/HAM1 family non-canonical purine NTP pyrophosphatase, partial [Chloroflexota bacterium]
NNRGKVAEYRALLKNIPYELVTPGELGLKKEVVESGRTFEENAGLKATALAAESGLLTLADDSGLEVEALGREPGPLSARYAGEGASDTDRIRYLLKRLEGVPWEERRACFRCVIALAGGGERLSYFSGECRGMVGFEPRGDSGFGYDPVFYLPELGKTMAELSFAEKNRLSHRGKAARKAARRLRSNLLRGNNRAEMR